MSSILTNTSSMVALQTLKSINSGLQDVQSQISTGKKVASAKDNAAVWAVSKIMESDVAGFKAVSESLSLASSTVAVAQNASETVTDLLTDMKGRIVAAQEANVDRDSIQADVVALRDQIKSVVASAQFNGLNLIDGSSADAMKVLASLDRSPDGSVNDAKITVERQSLAVTNATNTAATLGGVNLASTAEADKYLKAGSTLATIPTAGTTTSSTTASIASGGSLALTIGRVEKGATYTVALGGVQVNTTDGEEVSAGRTFNYVASADDSTGDVARKLGEQIQSYFETATDADEGYSVTFDSANSNKFTIENAAGGVTTAMTVWTAMGLNGEPADPAAGAGLNGLDSIDVSSQSGAEAALAAIDGLIQTSIDASAAFGSAQSRIENQSNFVSTLSDGLKAGIGALVDADMEEASARLQALQVQQQLGVQSLSIANQAPQSILSLFR